MKQILTLSLILFFIGNLKSQISITTDNILQEGDNVTLRPLFDVDGSFDVGSSGENVIWDFSGLVEDGTSEVFGYIDETALPYADQMDVVEFAEQINGGSDGYFYFNTNGGTNWERSGWYVNDGGSIMWIEYTDMSASPQPLELVQYPFTYNDQFSSNFQAYGEYDMAGTTDGLQVSLGSYNFDCDAYGTLILPHKVYQNAVRVHVTEQFTLELMFMGTPMITSDITDDAYYWYVEGVKGPVMSYVVSTTDGSPNYSAKWFREDYTQIESVDFVADMTTGNTDDTFTLTNLSEPLNQGSTFEWTFTPSTVTYMEGTDATSVHPKVQFDAPGFYTAELTITNGSFATTTATETKTDYIEISAAPELVIDFEADNQNVTTGGMVNITNMTVPDATGGTTYQWNLAPASGWHFDMFTDATSENPVITFDSDGCYAIQLVATNSSFSNSPVTETRMQYFNVGGVSGCPVWVGFEEVKREKLMVYPNPSESILNIKNDKAFTIKMVNISGQVVLEENSSSNHVALDVSRFERGVYFITVSDNESTKIEKVILK